MIKYEKHAIKANISDVIMNDHQLNFFDLKDSQFRVGKTNKIKPLYLFKEK